MKRPAGRYQLLKRAVGYKELYLMLVPILAFYLIFSYVPMYGITLAFKDFNYAKGILASPWNQFANFKKLFASADFWRAFRNTIIISLGRLIIEFPIPIILALFLNEISRSKLKRVYQTILTFPHFLSWVVLSGIVITLLQDQGVLNQILALFGLGKNRLLVNGNQFVGLLFASNIWKEAGWSTILYMAAIAGINPELYEAATLDGCSRMQRMWYITWPGILSTAAVLFILQVGSAMNGGFDQVFNLYNSAVYSKGDIIDTYVYRSAFQSSDGFGFSTAVGFTKSVINFGLLYLANKVVSRLTGTGVI
ncbi:MAG: ABC transporter permease subunit [Oscillospiraceae bacterium]|nr:ABC transporter permease subunit [Oscillospiraceae bacterium]MDD4368055.1 ABC transporter permease subunit [Oscillospiraceae bacterium]